MPKEAQGIAARLGLTSHQDHRGRQLVADEVPRADVVFAMDREHWQAVVKLHPPTVRYAYTLTDFAHVASNVPKTDLVEMVQRADDPEHGALDAVQRLRGIVPPLESPENQDIEDPLPTLYGSL